MGADAWAHGDERKRAPGAAYPSAQGLEQVLQAV